MKNYLITGIAGTGKSAVGDALLAKGYRIVETDRVSGNKIVYRQRNDSRNNQPSTYQRGDGWAELQHVRWQIDPDKLRPDLQRSDSEIQFVCGYADNWADFRDDFDGIFLLEAGPSIIRERLLTRVTGDWGRKHPEELRHAVETAQEFNNSIKLLGATVIDAEKPVDDIVAQILHSIKSAN